MFGCSPGQDADKHITERSVQRVFEKACKKAGIKKKATVHWLPTYWKMV